MNSIKHLKRSVLFFLSLIMVISCSNEIYFKNSENSFDRLFVQEQIGISMSRTFLWDDGGAGAISFSENGDSMRITGLQSWLNGVGFERNDSFKYYDLTDVAYMTFKVHGTMPLERAKVSVSSTGGSYGDDFNLKYWSVDPENYSETTDSTILIDLSSMDAESMKMVERIFLFIANNDDKTEGIPLYESGQWMEISGIDFLNADKQHVDIRYEEIEYDSGSLEDAFNRLDIGAVDLQSWEGTSRIEVRNTGLRIYSLGGTWFGGAVAAPSGEYVDFSDVSAITFEVRGNMKPEEVEPMAKLMNIPIVGLAQNMSYVECPKCKEKIYVFGENNVLETAKKFGIKSTASLPISKDYATVADRGLMELYEGDYLDSIADEIEKTKNKKQF